MDDLEFDEEYNSLIMRVFRLMESDEESPSKQSYILTQVYRKATNVQKRVLDDAFAALCGYTLDTLINRPDDVSYS